MKKIQLLRFLVQAICLVLIGTSVFINFKIGILIILGITFFIGAFSCGWICPYGFMQDIFGKLGDFIGIKKRKMPKQLQNIFVFTRYLLLGAVLFITLDIIFNAASLDPRVNFEAIITGKAFKISALVTLSVFLLISMFFERPFCNYMCIEGAKQGLIGTLRLFTIKRDVGLCVNCKRCDKACPMNINVSKSINLRSPQCVDCLKCISSCPVKGALKFGVVKFDKLELKKYIAVLISMMLLFGAYTIYNFYSENTTKKDVPAIEEISPDIKSDAPVAEEVSPEIKEDVVSAEEASPEVKGDVAVTEEANPAVKDNNAVAEENQVAEAEVFKGIANGVPDGVYKGEGEGFRGPMTVEVTVKNNLITNIEVTDNVDDRKWFDRANSAVPDRIITAQNTEIDLVSGATYSSIGIRDAVKNALKNR